MRIAFVGFGNVGQAFADLLSTKHPLLKQAKILPQTTGIFTRRQGGVVCESGIPLSQAAYLLREQRSLRSLTPHLFFADAVSFIRHCPADIIIEITTLNYLTGEPALTHLRTALASGKHVITANKGPIAVAYDRLRAAAKRYHRQLRFEGTVMDGFPVFNLVEQTLPCSKIVGFRGILNSTTNYLLTEMEHGLSADSALMKARELGIAEEDPSADIEGWDTAAKVAALANVWLRAGTTPQQIHRRGIAHLTPDRIRRARDRGRAIRLIGRAFNSAEGLRAYVRPE
jgi:homoserine dehydrogenase